MPRGGRPITQEFYTALVDAYRQIPGNASHAARQAGCAPQTAQRAWELGWTRLHSWAKPIKAVLLQEKQDAQLVAAKKEREREAQREKDRELARSRVIEAKADEEQTIRVGRKDVLGVLVIAAELNPAMRLLAKRVTTILENPATVVDLKEAMGVLNRYALFAARAVDAADTITKLSRLGNDEATEIVKTFVEYATPQDAAREIEEASEALARVKARGLLPDEPTEAVSKEELSDLH